MDFCIKHFGEDKVQDNETHGILVDYDYFVELLEQSSTVEDKSKFRLFNVHRATRHDLIEIGGQKWLTLNGLLKYVLQRADTVEFCKFLVNDVHRCLAQSEGCKNCNIRESLRGDKIPSSFLEVYRIVASTSFRDDLLDIFYKEHLNHKNITIEQDHLHEHFTEEEWERIIFFEYHYQTDSKVRSQKDTIHEAKRRYEYFTMLQNASLLASELQKINTHAVSLRNKRKCLSHAEDGVQVHGQQSHLYSMLDNELNHEFRCFYGNSLKTVVIPSGQPGSVNICVEYNHDLSNHLSDFTELASKRIHDKHCLAVEKVFILEEGCISRYYREAINSYARFILYDDILLDKAHVVAIANNNNYTDMLEEPCETTKCEICFPDKDVTPLKYTNFQILEEWLFETPLAVQLILESAISIRSLKLSNDKVALMTSKLRQLYVAYDSLLNCSNRFYAGILQETNTLELMMHSKSQQAVFNVASGAGISMSEKSANRFLEENSVDDLCYYNTYIKKYPVTYMKNGKLVTEDVSLRDCHNAIMIDNLVRLKFRSDPKRGEHRSNQIDTLPSTIQGIPKDCDEVRRFHIEECPIRKVEMVIDDEEDPVHEDVEVTNEEHKVCKCRIPENIPPDNVVPLLVTKQKKEEEAAEQFSDLCTFGMPEFQAVLAEGENLQKIFSIVPRNTPSTPMERSMEVPTTPSTSDATRSMMIDCDLSVDERRSGMVNRTPVASNLDLDSAQFNKIVYEAQRTPIRLRSNECFSTPVEASGNVRPMVFNTMSPLKPTSVVVPDDAQEISIFSGDMDGSVTDTLNATDKVNNLEQSVLPGLIGKAILDSYDLLEEHQEERRMFVIPDPDKISPTLDHMDHGNLMQAAYSRGNQDPQFRHEPGTMQDGQTSEEPKTSSDSEDPKTTEIPKTSPLLPKQFGFTKHICTNLLTRHPPPAMGQDDDPDVLQDDLDDKRMKLGHYNPSVKGEKIVVPVDHKLGKNIFHLHKFERNKMFLAEFPLLHVRKHKITVLFAAYKNAGILELLRYMRDEEEEDWQKLISAAHIDKATLHIRRLSATFHAAFLAKFANDLPEFEEQKFKDSLENDLPSITAQVWGVRYRAFVRKGCKLNATFCLHYEMMLHMDDVLAVSLAERLGGNDGYNLLLAAMKSSLIFSYLNGASSYAVFITNLLDEHYSASPFDKAMKAALYSTPRPGSVINFAGDTKREMDHLDALKGFKSGSTPETITQRMSLVDIFAEIHANFNAGYGIHDQASDTLGWKLGPNDWKHILPTVAVILRRGGLSLTEAEIPCNVYLPTPAKLDPVMLDSISAPAGMYLLHRSVCDLELHGFTKANIPDGLKDADGDQGRLIKKVAASKATTIRRAAVKTKLKSLKSKEDQEREANSKNKNRMMHDLERSLSTQNMCQALLTPDGKKSHNQKSVTIPGALNDLIQRAQKTTNQEQKTLIIKGKPLCEVLSEDVMSTAQILTVEFGGVKYKVSSRIPSGIQYLESIKRDIFKKYLNKFSNLKLIVICEEKYAFTPDTLKGPARQDRMKQTSTSTSHLKEDSEILSDTHFSKMAILRSGKILISNYLASKIKDLEITNDVEVIIDSQMQMEGCDCTGKSCVRTCNKYAVPLHCQYSSTQGYVCSERLTSVKQRKGEGEMSQVDWLVNSSSKMLPGSCAISLVTSADIDAVVVHLVAVSRFWPRDQDQKFIHPVYVLLQKTRHKGKERFDLYLITDIIELLEAAFEDELIAVKVGLALCIGGNDFLPKYHKHGTHAKVMKVFEKQYFRDNLFDIQDADISLNRDVYVKFVMQLYSTQDVDRKTFNEVREKTLAKHENRELWLPPLSCVQQMASLTAAVIDYILTAGYHDACLPDISKVDCLKTLSNGDVVYDFGSDAYHATKKTDKSNCFKGGKRKRSTDSGAVPKKLLSRLFSDLQ